MTSAPGPRPVGSDTARGVERGGRDVRGSRRAPTGPARRPGRDPWLAPVIALLFGGGALTIVLVAVFVLGLGPTNGPVSPSPLGMASPSVAPSAPPSPVDVPVRSPGGVAAGSPAAGVSPSAAPSMSPSATLRVEVAGLDAPDLPRVAGAIRTGFEQGTDGAVAWSLSRFHVPAHPDIARAHYRQMFVDHGWFVGEVDYQAGHWRFVANRGPREVVVELEPDGEGTLATVYLSDLVAPPAAPTVAPTPETRPDRTPRPRATARPDTERPDAEPTRRPNRTPRPDPTPRPERTERPERTPRPTPRPTPKPDRDGDEDDDDGGRDDDDDDEDDGDDDDD